MTKAYRWREGHRGGSGQFFLGGHSKSQEGFLESVTWDLNPETPKKQPSSFGGSGARHLSNARGLTCPVAFMALHWALLVLGGGRGLHQQPERAQKGATEGFWAWGGVWTLTCRPWEVTERCWAGDWLHHAGINTITGQQEISDAIGSLSFPDYLATGK